MSYQHGQSKTAQATQRLDFAKAAQLQAAAEAVEAETRLNKARKAIATRALNKLQNERNETMHGKYPVDPNWYQNRMLLHREIQAHDKERKTKRNKAVE